MASVKPLGDRVLVQVARQERVTSGGILLPDSVREESDRGVVVAVGPGLPEVHTEWMSSEGPGGNFSAMPSFSRGLRKVPVEVGQVILFSPYAGSKVGVGGEEYLLLREHDILGVLDGAVAVPDERGGVSIREEEAATA